MKKIFLIISLAVLTVVFAFPVSAYYFNTKETIINANDFKYRVIDNKYIEIVKGEGFIPAEIDGLPVTIIANGAYITDEYGDDYSYVDEAFTIPETITYIGNYAFEYCDLIKNLTIPSSVTYIGKGAFEHCYNMKSVNIASSISTIPDYAFAFCNKLEKVKLPDRLEIIGDSAFFYCGKLSDINTPEALWSIGKAAFYNCKSLKKFDFSNIMQLGRVGEKSLGYCYNKKEIMEYYDSKKAKNSSLLKGFKIISSPDDLFDNGLVKYALSNKIPLTFNVNSKDTTSTFMGEVGAGNTAKIIIDGKSLSDIKAKNPKIISITKSGKVTGLKKGNTKITATLSDGTKYTGSFSVKNNPKLSKSSVSVKKGKTVSVKITGKASSINNKYTNTKYAKITSKNTAKTLKVKGLKKGSTTLKVTVNGVTIKLKVKVTAK